MDLPQSGWIGFFAAAICAPLILWAVNRRKPGAARRNVAKAGPIVMALMGAAVLLFGGPAVLMVLGLLPGKDVDELWVQLVFAGFALLAPVMLAREIVGWRLQIETHRPPNPALLGLSLGGRRFRQ